VVKVGAAESSRGHEAYRGKMREMEAAS
jgi:hypothetical protein